MNSGPTPNTQAILLLCAKLGQRDDSLQVLTAKQYSILAKWLQERYLLPASLLHNDGRARLADLEVKGVDRERVERLLDRGGMLGLMHERWTRSGIWIVSREDQDYPQRYNTCLEQAAPPILYGVGEPSLLQKGGLAIVGSRHASEEDLAFARRLGTACAKQSVPTISGAAKGIDSESMMAAINRGGSAIGVLAEGLGRAAVASSYHDAILDGRLTLISPYEPESQWFPFRAMERNKLIYALADAAVIVASSSQQGGTWAGAVEALKEGQIPIYVKAYGELSAGNRKLIEAGAYEFPSDVFHALSTLFANSSRSLLLFKKENPHKGSQSAETAVETRSESAAEIQPDLHPDKSKLKGNDCDMYNHFLEVILDVAAEPLNCDSIAKKLNVSPSRAKAWLKRAFQEGKVQKVKKPVRYVRPVSEPSLFSELQEIDGEPEIIKKKGHIL
jgi:predicted Rossmann fold nucleotide-binding protein DprA/Smf involved in DNA uptake